MNPKTKLMLSLAAAAMLVAMVPSPAQAGTLFAHLDAPFVVGDQLFAGGELQLRPVGGGGGLVALLVDGQQVALLFTEKTGSSPLGSQKFLVFYKDQRGMLYLSGMKTISPASARGLSIAMNVAALSPGLATVPPLFPYRGETARASR